MKINKTLGGIFGTILSSMGMVISAEQLDHIVSIICSVVGAIIVILTSVIIPLAKWYKKAKADGKITKDEIQEGVDIVKNGIDELKDKSGKEE